ncbi:MAG: antibiotic biosynthesis monooxygenase family protein [Terriglobales bacterium]
MAFVIVWEFMLRTGMQEQFEEAYGDCGAWASLFRSDPAYIRTELIQDVCDASRYLTLDFWESEAAYEAFRERRKNEYRDIDAKCEQMTEAEREVGKFRVCRTEPPQAALAWTAEGGCPYDTPT